MAEQRTITCDCCQGDITSSEGVPRYRLVGSLSLRGDIGASVLAARCLEWTYHFCGRSCLVEWLTREVE